MKKNVIFKAIVLLFLSACLHFNAQNLLWNANDIQQNEADLTKAFQKYQKKQSREKFRTEFLNIFKERTVFHESVIDDILKESDEKKDWLNRLRSLQYIYELSFPVLSQNNIPYRKLNSVLDSVTALAVKNLYARGQKALENQSEYNHLSKAYRAFTAVQQLHPGYEKTQELLEELKLYNKKAYLKPLKISNNGNYFIIEKGGTSLFHEHIITRIAEDINQYAIGFKIENDEDIKSDYEIELDWKSINYNSNPSLKNTYERSVKLGDKTIIASITYDTQKMSFNSLAGVKIKEKITGRVIDEKTFTVNEFGDYVTASYTGDWQALTMQDKDIINYSRTASLNKFQDELLYLLYDKELHPLICKFINNTIGW